MNFKELIEYYNNNFESFFKNDWIGGVGMGYREGEKIASKLYINFAKSIDTNLFPFNSIKSLYIDFLKYKDETRCANDSIAIKHYKMENVFSEYFHIKLTNSFTFNITDKLLNINLDNLDKGVTVEKIKDNIFIKRYYYIRDKLSIALVLKHFQINEDYNNIKYIEYTSEPKKIILIFNDTKQAQICAERNLNTLALTHINNISDRFNSVPVLYGKYFSLGIEGVYWDLYKQNIGILNALYE